VPRRLEFRRNASTINYLQNSGVQVGLDGNARIGSSEFSDYWFNDQRQCNSRNRNPKVPDGRVAKAVQRFNGVTDLKSSRLQSSMQDTASLSEGNPPGRTLKQRQSKSVF
jgi:hypothetical protein